MQTIQLTTQVGKDGILQVKMPENMSGQNLNVTLVFESISELNYPENAAPLKGTVISYDEPFESAIPLEDWDVLS